MSLKCRDIMDFMEELAPKELAESWDNPGLLVGNSQQEVKKVLVALDATAEVVEEAERLRADIIVTHHPILFRPIKNVTSETELGRRIIKLIQRNISVYAAHTNLDIAKGGTNDTLAVLLHLQDLEPLIKLSSSSCQEQKGILQGMGRIGNLPRKMPFRELAASIKEKLGLDNIRVIAGNLEMEIQKVGLCTGAGSEFMEEALEQGAQAYITADLKYHEAQKALEMGLCVIDATHYASEVIIVPVLCDYLKKKAQNFGEELTVIASSVNGQTFQDI